MMGREFPAVIFNRRATSALSLGASRWEIVYRVLFPAAKNGLLAAVLLGVGRVIGFRELHPKNIRRMRASLKKAVQS